MKTKISIISFLLLISSMCYAQFPTFDCNAVASKKITAKKLVDGKNYTIDQNSKFRIISWRYPTDEFYPQMGPSLSSELVVELNNTQYAIDINDTKKLEFSAPQSNKQFWETFCIQNGVIQNLAKNGIRTDLRGELDGESIEFIEMLEKGNLIFDDEYLTDYVQSLIFKIHPGMLSDKRPGVLNLIIYHESNPNAFSLPNGTIAISTGLFSIIDSEEELIGVLAHEIAHFVGDHHINNLLAIEKRAKRAEFWAGVATVLAATADVYMASTNDYYTPGMLTYGTAVISSEIAASMVDRFGMKYSQEQEFQADEAAYDAMNFLQSEPEAYISALSKIGNYYYRVGNYAPLVNSHTHPSMQSRLSKLNSSVKNYYSDDFQYNVSFLNTLNAQIEFRKKHYLECEKLVDKNIKTNVATENDYLLKAMTIRILYGDEEHNKLALKYLDMAENLKVEPNSYIIKQKGITYLRLGQLDNARKSFEDFLNEINKYYDENGNVMTDSERTAIQNEISWTKKMIYKTTKKV